MSAEDRTLFDRGLYSMCTSLRKRVETVEGLIQSVSDIMLSLNEELQCHHDLLHAIYTGEVSGKVVKRG